MGPAAAPDFFPAKSIAQGSTRHNSEDRYRGLFLKSPDEYAVGCFCFDLLGERPTGGIVRQHIPQALNECVECGRDPGVAMNDLGRDRA